MACSEIVVKPDYRPCYVKAEGGERKAVFHTWSQYANPVEPSPMVGGSTGGQLSRTYGIVEYEDGHVEQVSPGFIRFVDHTPFHEMTWAGKGGIQRE